LRRAALGLVALPLALAPGALAETKPAPPPWVRHVAPDRLCLQFGHFDWLRYIRDTDRIARAGRTDEAAARERALGESLWYLGRGTGRICSCGPKAAVLGDLRRLLPELKKRPGIAHQDMTAADHVAGTIAGIEAGGIAVVPPQHQGCKR
jgi:hypothetical protein